MRGKRHDDETRAAVLGALIAGQSVTEVATAYKLDPSVVSRWKSSISPEQLQEVAQKRASDFSELVGDYLCENLETLKVQVRQFRNPEWLKKQRATEVAVLHGILCDKAFRILEAAERAAGAEPAGG